MAKRTIEDIAEQQAFFIQALDKNVNALAELVKVFKELSHNVALLADASGEMLNIMVSAKKSDPASAANRGRNREQSRKPKRP